VTEVPDRLSLRFKRRRHLRRKQLPLRRSVGVSTSRTPRSLRPSVSAQRRWLREWQAFLAPCVPITLSPHPRFLAPVFPALPESHRHWDVSRCALAIVTSRSLVDSFRQVTIMHAKLATNGEVDYLLVRAVTADKGHPTEAPRLGNYVFGRRPGLTNRS
jgi:hypothetical protein